MMLKYILIVLSLFFKDRGYANEFFNDRSSKRNATKQRVFYPPSSVLNDFLEDLQKPSVTKINRDLQPSFDWQGIRWMIDSKAKNLHPLWTTTPVDQYFMVLYTQESPFLSCLYSQKDEKRGFYNLPLIPAGDLINLEAIVDATSNSLGFAYFFSYQEIDSFAYVAESVTMNSVT